MTRLLDYTVQLISLFLVLSAHPATTVATDQYGNEFYFGAMKNHHGETSRLWLTVTSKSPEGNVTFTVEVMEFRETKTIPYNQPSVSVELPLSAIVNDWSYDHRLKGIHLFTHDKDDLVSVVVFNWRNGSVGEYTSLPSTVGFPSLMTTPDSDFVYYAMSIGPPTTAGQSGLWSQVLLVGCQDNTLVTITPSQPMYVPIVLQDSYSPPVRLLKGQSHSVTLNAGETLLLGSESADITGTEIRADKHVTVVSGHECGNVPRTLQWCEHLIVQIPPAHSWGNEFILVPFKGRENGQYFKMLSKHESTKVTIHCNGTSGAFLNGSTSVINLQEKADSDSFFLDSWTYCHLVSDKPVLLVQLSLGSKFDQIGDPTMILQPPIQQYTTSLIVFQALPLNQFIMSYVNIMIMGDPTSVLYDGKPLCNDTSCFHVVQNSNGETIGYCYRMEVQPARSGGVHTLTAGATSSISAVLYGFNASPSRAYGHVLTNQLNLLNEKLFVSFDKQEYLVQENLTTVVVTIYCKANFTTNSSVLVKTIPADSDDFNLPDDNAIINCHAQGHTTELAINIINDNLIEPIEEFQVTIAPVVEDEVFDSINNTTTVRIIDDDYVTVGFLDELKIVGDLLMVRIGILEGANQLEDSIVVNFKININSSASYMASHDVSLSYLVPSLSVSVNLARLRIQCLVNDVLVWLSESAPSPSSTSHSNTINIVFMEQPIEASSISHHNENETTSQQVLLLATSTLPNDIQQTSTVSMPSTVPAPSNSGQSTRQLITTTISTALLTTDGSAALQPSSSTTNHDLGAVLLQGNDIIVLASIGVAGLILVMLITIASIVLLVLCRKRPPHQPTVRPTAVNPLTTNNTQETPSELPPPYNKII